MEHRTYKLSFATPAFIGNSNQNGQWRVPPFKSLLRQWWRVVVANDKAFDLKLLQQREQALFGGIHDDGDNKASKSKVRLRLEHWNAGTMNSPNWPKKGFGKVNEQVNSDVYLGYGPVSSSKGETLKHPPAINPGESNRVTLSFSPACTAEQIRQVEQAMQLAAWFGTLGGRARNGWGSLIIEGEGIEPFPDDDAMLQRFSRPLAQALQSEWCQGLAYDQDGLLVWTATAKSWPDAVNQLAQLRKDTRTAVKGMPFGGGVSASCLLGYPITKVKAQGWSGEARLPNSLRFKLLPYEGELLLCVSHFPCAIPKSLWKSSPVNNSQQLLTIWQAVHDVLDSDDHWIRLGGGV